MDEQKLKSVESSQISLPASMCGREMGRGEFGS